MSKNGNGVFATETQIEPVKITVGARELFVYNAQEDSVWEHINGAFGLKSKRTYTKRAKTDKTWGEDTKTKRPYTKKSEKELVAA